MRAGVSGMSRRGRSAAKDLDDECRRVQNEKEEALDKEAQEVDAGIKI